MIIHPQQSEHVDLLGGKAGALARLSQSDCRIPPWFAVTDGDASSREAILESAKKLGGDLFAVRSSASGEDGADHSFAGQYDTFLYVELKDLPDRIRRVHQSHQSDHLRSYQDSKKIDQIQRPTALVQHMLHPEVSGVAFSADPVSGRRQHCLVSALWGTGSALVSGEADADTWTIDKDNCIVDTKIADKSRQHVPCPDSAEGVALIDTPSDKRSLPCLGKEQVLAVANMARQCAEHFGYPQDIEWAYEKNQLYLLQSRPITTLAHTPNPDDPLTVWDNSNIAESYSGITSPLTFSFAQRAYEHVYREFCRLLSVPRQRIEDNDYVFPAMLGHIHGHVYYNLNSWYHVLAMLPGFSVNRSFMEQMMGVKEPMPGEVVADILQKTRTSKLKDSWALGKTVLGLIKNHRSLQRQIDAFYQRLERALGDRDKPLDKMTGKELACHYRDLESQLLKHWDAPLINDFFAMIYYGTLKSLCEKWLNDGSLQNTLLVDAGEIISAEPPRRIHAMAAQVARDKTLTDLLANPHTKPDEKLAQLARHGEIFAAYNSYLEDFGDRCLEELKLESPSVGDNPQSLLTGIGVMAKRHSSGRPSGAAPVPEPPTAVESLSGWKKKVFSWVLQNARDRVRDRENLRFERTKLFGRVRRIVVELGKRLHTAKHLDQPGDVFFLTITEVMGAYEGTTSPQTLRDQCRQRKRQQDAIRAVPPDRFETRGSLDRYSSFTPSSKEAAHEGAQLHGTGACPGIVRGTVRVVTDPRHATLAEGEILVAQQTDPGWVVLFPAASGLLVERGSLLSHSAIVARELQLPCVVSIRNITSILSSGDFVEMNGSTGEVNIIDTAQPNPPASQTQKPLG